jgi:kumamolisin
MTEIHTTWVMNKDITVEEMNSIKTLCHNNQLICNQKDYRHLSVDGKKEIFSTILNNFYLKDKITILGDAKSESRLIRSDPFRPRLGGGPFTPPQLAAIYDFPNGDGAGTPIGIIGLDGRYLLSDIVSYLAYIGVAGMPTIIDRYLDGATPGPGNPSSNGELTLDMEVVAGICPAATLYIYMTVDRGISEHYDCLNQAKIDGCRIITDSWGVQETVLTRQQIQLFDQVIDDCAAQNINVFAAAGDYGSSYNFAGNNMIIPAACKNSISVCGTTLLAPFGLRVDEYVWNNNQYTSSTGGGISKYIKQAAYQNKLHNFGGYRLAADIAGLADPQVGYVVLVNGNVGSVGGTSATAPLFAGLFARINTIIGNTLAFINPVIYNLPNQDSFYDVTSGSNGFYKATPGYDVCSGLGVPDGNAMLAIFSSV